MEHSLCHCTTDEPAGAPGGSASESLGQAGELHRTASEAQAEADITQETSLMRQSVAAARLRSSPEASSTLPVVTGVKLLCLLRPCRSEACFPQSCAQHSTRCTWNMSDAILQH